MKIIAIDYSFFEISNGKRHHDKYIVDQTYIDGGKVTKIEKHFPQGEGDRHYCTVYFDTGSIKTIYNVDVINEIED